MSPYNNNKSNHYINAQHGINPCFNDTLLQNIIRYEKLKVIKEEWDIVAKQLRILCEGLRDAVGESNDILQNGTKHLRK